MRNLKWSLGFVLILTAGFVLGGCASKPPPAPVGIRIHGLKFDPPEVTVHAGAKVVWTNDDDFDHDVTSGKSFNGRETKGMSKTKFPDGKFQSGLFGKGKTYEKTFTKEGTYPYYCNIHPFMTAVVNVVK